MLPLVRIRSMRPSASSTLSACGSRWRRAPPTRLCWAHWHRSPRRCCSRCEHHPGPVAAPGCLAGTLLTDGRCAAPHLRFETPQAESKSSVNTESCLTTSRRPLNPLHIQAQSSLLSHWEDSNCFLTCISVVCQAPILPLER